MAKRTKTERFPGGTITTTVNEDALADFVGQLTTNIDAKDLQKGHEMWKSTDDGIFPLNVRKVTITADGVEVEYSGSKQTLEGIIATTPLEPSAIFGKTEQVPVTVRSHNKVKNKKE